MNEDELAVPRANRRIADRLRAELAAETCDLTVEQVIRRAGGVTMTAMQLTREQAAERLRAAAESQERVNERIGGASVRSDEIVLAARMGADALSAVDRLRGRLAELEWAGGTGKPPFGRCPVCWKQEAHGHEPDCWLAATISGGSGDQP